MEDQLDVAGADRPANQRRQHLPVPIRAGITLQVAEDLNGHRRVRRPEPGPVLLDPADEALHLGGRGDLDLTLRAGPDLDADDPEAEREQAEAEHQPPDQAGPPPSPALAHPATAL